MFRSQRQGLIDLGAASPAAIAADFALGAAGDLGSDRDASRDCRPAEDKDATRRTQQSRRCDRWAFPTPCPSSASLSSARLGAIGEIEPRRDGGFDTRSDSDYPKTTFGDHR